MMVISFWSLNIHFFSIYFPMVGFPCTKRSSGWSWKRGLFTAVLPEGCCTTASQEPPLPSPVYLWAPCSSHQLLSLGLSCPPPVHKHGVYLIAITGQQLCPAPVTLNRGDARPS